MMRLTVVHRRRRHVWRSAQLSWLLVSDVPYWAILARPQPGRLAIYGFLAGRQRLQKFGAVAAEDKAPVEMHGLCSNTRILSGKLRMLTCTH